MAAFAASIDRRKLASIQYGSKHRYPRPRAHVRAHERIRQQLKDSPTMSVSLAVTKQTPIGASLTLWFASRSRGGKPLGVNLLASGATSTSKEACESLVYDASMISIADLRAIAEARLEDAKVLAANGRTDGAAYLCGYAVELALKARICVTLNWSGFPETRGEFENFSNFKTHKLDVLLALSGHEQRIKAGYFDDWSAIAKWDPEVRYRVIGQTSAAQVALIIEAVENLLGTL